MLNYHRFIGVTAALLASSSKSAVCCACFAEFYRPKYYKYVPLDSVYMPFLFSKNIFMLIPGFVVAVLIINGLLKINRVNFSILNVTSFVLLGVLNDRFLFFRKPSSLQEYHHVCCEDIDCHASVYNSFYEAINEPLIAILIYIVFSNIAVAIFCAGWRYKRYVGLTVAGLMLWISAFLIFASSLELAGYINGEPWISKIGVCEWVRY